MSYPKLGAKAKYLPGVTKPKNKPGYISKAYRERKVVCLGTYDTEQEAHEAYVKFITENPPGSKARKPTLTIERSAYDNLRTAWNNL